MNNSRIRLEESDDTLARLRTEESRIVRIIEALDEVISSAGWKTLKTEVFDGVSEALEKRLKAEANKKVIDVPECNQLQGQLVWARKFSKMEDLREFFKTQLTNFRKQIHDKSNGGA